MINRIPPHNDEAERSVLGAAMLDKNALYEILEEVREDDFYQENHREIFKSIWELQKESSAVDMLTVCDKLKNRNSLDMVGGRGYIAQLTASVPAVVNAGEYAKIVSEKSLLRQMIMASEDISNKGYSGEADAKEILDFAESSIFSIAEQKQRSSYEKIQDLLMKNIEIISESAKNDEGLMGTPTGFKALDEKTSGFQKSDLIILAARPAMGKTAFALNIAQQSAIKSGSSVMIFSLEMSKTQLSQRLLAVEARVDMEKFKNGSKLDQSDWERMTLALDAYKDAKIFIDDTPDISVIEMRNKCRRLKREQGLDLIIIDYIQLMTSGGRFDNRQQEVSSISRSLKLLAREMDCPVVVLSQLSREVEKRSDKRPMLSDLRESGAIEQDADIVLFLYRDDYYNPETTEKPGICDVIIAKHRSGSTGSVELTWVSRYTKFSDKAL